eukprot:9487253-Pyramimonas_sp.AAC.1
MARAGGDERGQTGNASAGLSQRCAASRRRPLLRRSQHRSARLPASVRAVGSAAAPSEEAR